MPAVTRGAPLRSISPLFLCLGFFLFGFPFLLVFLRLWLFLRGFSWPAVGRGGVGCGVCGGGPGYAGSAPLLGYRPDERFSNPLTISDLPELWHGKPQRVAARLPDPWAPVAAGTG